MSPKKEDYLKIIFELGGKNKKISNKQISISLNVAAGSVTEMTNRLAKEKLVRHEPYAGIRLTPEGVKVAEDLIRRHRLWETFLVKKLGYKLSDVHKDAEILEHATSDNLMDHLEKFLNEPTHCPHGGVIPTKDGKYKEDSHQVLANLEDGKEAIIDRFIDNHDLLEYLSDIKLNIGDKVKVIEHTPFEGAITIELNGSKEKMDIGYKAAHYIFVR